jgi:hypothetical protein
MTAEYAPIETGASTSRFFCALIAFGVAALFGLSALGGAGGNSGRSIWWLALCVSYPIGWLLGLFGAASNLRDHRTSPA